MYFTCKSNVVRNCFGLLTKQQLVFSKSKDRLVNSNYCLSFQCSLNCPLHLANWVLFGLFSKLIGLYWYFHYCCKCTVRLTYHLPFWLEYYCLYSQLKYLHLKCYFIVDKHDWCYSRYCFKQPVGFVTQFACSNTYQKNPFIFTPVCNCLF